MTAEGRLDHIEKLIGMCSGQSLHEGYTLIGGLTKIADQVKELSILMRKQKEKESGEKSDSEGSETPSIIRVLHRDVENLKRKLDGSPRPSEPRLRFKVPEPKPYDSSRLLGTPRPWKTSFGI